MVVTDQVNGSLVDAPSDVSDRGGDTAEEVEPCVRAMTRPESSDQRCPRQVGLSGLPVVSGGLQVQGIDV